MIGVVGLGVMGLGIAQVFAAAGQQVAVMDGHGPARDAALSRIGTSLSRRVASGKLSKSEMHHILARITVVDTLSGLADCDMVIEAIVEDIDAKCTLFAALEDILNTSAVLATNTSALSIAGIAEVLKRPERLLGLHFFNPAPAMKLVELVTLPGNAPDAVAFARNLTKSAGKVVIDCPDRPGFIVNRCARPFYGEALAMLEDGRTADDIDAAMLAAGYRLGPFALIDLVGADINLAATQGLYDQMGRHPRYHVFDRLKAQVASGNLGRKTGQGFVTDINTEPKADNEIVRRIEATLINEAASLLDEGQANADAIDTALKLGLNFPYGPFEAAQKWGVEEILDELNRLKKSAPDHLTGRYEISPALAAMAQV